VAKAKHWLALLPLERQEHTRAAAELEEVLLEFRRLGDHRQVSMVVGNIGGVVVDAGDVVRARPALTESLALAQRLGYRWWVAWCLNELARAAMLTGERERAARLIGAASALRPATGEPLRTGPQRAQDEMVATIRSTLGDAAATAALAAGAALPLDDVVAEALAAGAALPAQRDIGEADAKRSSPAAGILSARELGVLRLVAAGYTDREIADLLSIRPRTVNTHLSHILAKLDVANRRAAVARAREQGWLLPEPTPPPFT
jgi:non-specific serine/threonine protein kinase